MTFSSGRTVIVRPCWMSADFNRGITVLERKVARVQLSASTQTSQKPGEHPLK